MTPTRAGRTRWSLARLPLRSVRGPNVRMRGQPTKLNQTKPNEETRSSVSLQPKEDGASEKKQNKKHSKCERYAFTSKFANQKRFTLRRTPKVKQNYFRNRTQSAPTWTHPSCKRRATAAPPIDERLLAFLFVCLFCLLIFLLPTSFGCPTCARHLPSSMISRLSSSPNCSPSAEDSLDERAGFSGPSSFNILFFSFFPPSPTIFLSQAGASDHRVVVFLFVF